MSEQVESLESEATDVVDPWESSEAEALEDFGGEEAVTEDESVADESAGEDAVTDDPVEGEPDVEAVEETPVEEGTVAEPIAATPWDGDPATLPDELKQTHQAMVQGMNKKFTELADVRKEYETKLEALNAPQDVEPEGPPPLPSGDVSAEDWNNAQDARQRWFAKDELRQEREAQGKITAEQDAVTQSQSDAQARFDSLGKADGFTDEIAMAMAQVAQSDPYWAEQLRTSDEGTNALFKIVKYELAAQASETNKVKAAAAADEVIKAKHAAGKRSVSRPKSAASIAGDKYAMSGFADAEAQALDAWEKLP